MALWKQTRTHIRSGTLRNTHTTRWPRGAHTARAIFKGWLKNRGRRGTDTGDFSGQRHTAGGREFYLPGKCSALWSPRAAQQPCLFILPGLRTASKSCCPSRRWLSSAVRGPSGGKNRRALCQLAVQPANVDFTAHFKHFSGKALQVIGRNTIKGLENVYLNGFRLKSMNNVNTI